ncbi:hypothetical protein [Verrucomicrobium spinosum]|uniref:hypothetical protein n=1 Tax=Verrucomicrobium spinosum TaxID=2736 RepID=UPI000AF36A98|nr:hypothetical protein [Verrucomicrobium spinosum]
MAESPETFLKAGQVAAWRCGLAHYRESALAVADLLPPGAGAGGVDRAGEAGR